MGKAMKFRPEAFACYPPAAARWVIAHELAHVYQWATGCNVGAEDEKRNEREANELVRQWGISDLCRGLIAMRMQHGMSLKDACREVASLKIKYGIGPEWV